MISLADEGRLAAVSRNDSGLLPVVHGQVGGKAYEAANVLLLDVAQASVGSWNERAPKTKGRPRKTLG